MHFRLYPTSVFFAKTLFQLAFVVSTLLVVHGFTALPAVGQTAESLLRSIAHDYTPPPPPSPKAARDRIDWLLSELNRPVSDHVMVVAHRGDWRNAPENSIPALVGAALMGADMVEVDVKLTKDGVLIAMHDVALERTTTGKGLVSDMDWEEIRKLFLKNGTGVSRHRVPSFEEFMLTAKRYGVLVNVDKGGDYLEEIGAALKRTDTEAIAVVKSSRPPDELTKLIPKLGGAFFMPVVALNRDPNPSEKISRYIALFSPKVMEISFQNDRSPFFEDPSTLTRKGVKIWNTSCSFLWCGGRDDELAVDFRKPDQAWGWLLDHGATILLTDRPGELISYLKEKGRRSARLDNL